MPAEITFEDHSLLMQKLPIIFHREICCSTKQLDLINWHENIEILRVTRGEGSVLCGKTLHPLKKDQLFVINANDLHTIFSESTISYACLIIDRKFALYNGVDTSDILFQNRITDQMPLALFDRMRDVMERPDPTRLAVSAAVLSLLELLCRQYIKALEPDSVMKKESDPIRDALNYIRKNLGRQITLDDIADAAGMSKYHFSHTFKQVTGFSAMKFVSQQRCAFAQVLLTRNDYSIQQVAQLAGFQNPSYFSKVFLEHTGMLPSDYKAEASKEAAGTKRPTGQP